MSHVKFHMWNFTCWNMSHVKFHMWNFTCEISHVKNMSYENFTCEISHVKFHMWNFTCEISHVKNMSHGKHMGFEIHMCYWNLTCESHVNHMGNTSQFSVREIAINQAGPGSYQGSSRNWHTTWEQLNDEGNKWCLTKILEEIQDHGVITSRQEYSKCGPWSRIRTAKVFPVDRQIGSPVSANKAVK